MKTIREIQIETMLGVISLEKIVDTSEYMRSLGDREQSEKKGTSGLELWRPSTGNCNQNNGR